METMKITLKERILNKIIWRWKIVTFDLYTPDAHSKRMIRLRYWKWKWVSILEWSHGDKPKLEKFLSKHGINFYW